MNYKSLAAHNSACNWIFHKFQDCENEHPYRKYLGYCEQIQKQMKECIKEQREIRRKESAEFRYKRRQNARQENSN
ncbi:hypothetical protein ACFW04_008957 [Cataglyphis niger]